jgi:hypothetical protein
MSYGFEFYTGLSGSLTQVVSSDTAPGFIVPATTSVTITATSITNSPLDNVSELICNVQINPGTSFQPGLRSGQWQPGTGVVVSGPGLPADTQIVGYANRQNTSISEQNGARYILNKQTIGPISTAGDAYTLTNPSSLYPIVAYPVDASNYTNNINLNQRNQRPYPDTIVDFSSSPFASHDIIVFPPSYFNSPATIDSSYLSRPFAKPRVLIDQVAKIARINAMRNFFRVPGVRITVANPAGSTGTTVTTTPSSAVSSSFPRQEMYMEGPGYTGFGVRILARGASNSFTVETPPVGGWVNATNAYVIYGGGSPSEYQNLWTSGVDRSDVQSPQSGMWWKLAIIGRTV